MWSIYVVGTRISRFFSGILQTGILPDVFDAFDDLEWLILHSRTPTLSGDVPPSVFSANSVRVDLRNNQFDSLPESICDASNLQRLRLGNNHFGVRKRPIPSCISTLTKLQVLDLEHNQFTGSIPSFEKLTELRALKLNSAFVPQSFLQPLPSWIYNLTNIEMLQMEENRLEGTLGTEFGTLSDLTILSLRNNYISGTVPSEMAHMHEIQQLDLGFNKLNGTVPTFAPAIILSKLDLSFNGLTGSLPPLPADLVKGYFAENRFSGSLPKSFPYGLKELDLSHNEFSGSVPPSVCLNSLEQLRLYQTSLSDELPSCLSRLSKITLADFSFSHISGNLPDLTNWTSLQLLGAAATKIGGPLPQLPETTTEFLAGDALFTGQIPDSYGLQNLQKLNLNRNLLTGTVPDSLCNIPYFSVVENPLSCPFPICCQSSDSDCHQCCDPCTSFSS